MEFTKEYNLITGLQNGVRTHWTTKFFIDDTAVKGYRIINIGGTNKLYNLNIPIAVEESFSSVLNKVDKLTTIDDELFTIMGTIQARVDEDLEDIDD